MIPLINITQAISILFEVNHSIRNSTYCAQIQLRASTHEVLSLCVHMCAYLCVQRTECRKLQYKQHVCKSCTQLCVCVYFYL